MKKYKYLIVVLFLWLNVRSFAQLYMNPHSVAFANAYSTQARGANVIGWNPANLGLSGNPKFSMNFGFLPFLPFPSVQINNNAISPFRLNERFFTGGYLDDEDKEELLAFFPDDGLNINTLVQMRLLEMSFGNWAFSVGSEVTGSVVFPKSLFHFVFFGNEFKKPLDLSNTNVEMQSVVTVALAHGREVVIPYISDIVEQLSAGASIKALFGFGYAGSDKMDASTITFEDRIELDGDLEAKYGTGGFGMAFDIGLAAIINEKMSANISLNNLFGFLKWGLVEAEKVKYSYFMEIASEDFEYIDSLFEEGVQTDTSFSIDSFSSNYPSYLLLGFQYEVLPNLSLYSNIRQCFSDDFASSYLPKVSFAAEYKSIIWLPLRAGISFGGLEKFQWGIGSGLNFKNYSFNWGFSQIGGIFNYAKGFALSFGQQITF
ncbi:MAG: hypothetical protein ISS81_09810 [Candidatus Marinimicrobia bacterium]|nr:hypothetical protein [Candidatus Neomarinimicrobiota bacterium]